jgi:hypothetical protein
MEGRLLQLVAMALPKIVSAMHQQILLLSAKSLIERICMNSLRMLMKQLFPTAIATCLTFLITKRTSKSRVMVTGIVDIQSTAISQSLTRNVMTARLPERRSLRTPLLELGRFSMNANKLILALGLSSLVLMTMMRLFNISVILLVRMS